MLCAKFNSILSCNSREKDFLKYIPPLFLAFIFRIYISHDIKLLCFDLSLNGQNGSRKKAKMRTNYRQTDGQTPEKKMCDQKS